LREVWVPRELLPNGFLPLHQAGAWLAACPGPTKAEIERMPARNPFAQLGMKKG
jgi:hypothetical protein